MSTHSASGSRSRARAEGTPSKSAAQSTSRRPRLTEEEKAQRAEARKAKAAEARRAKAEAAKAAKAARPAKASTAGRARPMGYQRWRDANRAGILGGPNIPLYSPLQRNSTPPIQYESERQRATIERLARDSQHFDHEEAWLVNRNGDVVAHVVGGRDEIDEAQTRALHDQVGGNRGDLAFVHNHPDGRSFSNFDTGQAGGYRGYYALGSSDGRPTIYSLRTPSDTERAIDLEMAWPQNLDRRFGDRAARHVGYLNTIATEHPRGSAQWAEILRVADAASRDYLHTQWIYTADQIERATGARLFDYRSAVLE